MVRRLALCVAVSSVVALTGWTAAQERRSPPPPPPAAPEPPKPDYAGFSKAYETAGSPRILVVVGESVQLGSISTGIVGGAHASGVEATDTGAGRLNSDGDQIANGFYGILDPSGDAAGLKNTIEEHLTEVPDIRLVSLDALTEKDMREVRLSQGRTNADEVMRLLGTKTNADLILSVRMLSGEQIRQRGARYRVNVELINPATGRKLNSFFFDWREGVEAEDIKEYADAISTKFMKKFAEFYARPNAAAATYILRVLGVSDARGMKSVRDAAKKITGVKKIFDGELGNTDKTSVATMELRYEGSQWDLSSDLEDVFGKELGMHVAALDSGAGSITLAAKIQKPRGAGEILLDSADPGNKKALDTFRSLYMSKGEPKIAVIVNKELSDDEQSDAEVKAELEKAKAQIAALGAANAAGNGAATQPAGPAQAPISGGTFVTISLASNGDATSNNGSGGGGAPNQRGGGGDYRPQRDTKPERENKAHDFEKMEQSISNRRIENKIFNRLMRLNVQAIDPDAARAKLKKDQEKESRILDEKDMVFLLGRAADTDMVLSGVGRQEGLQVIFTFRVVRTASGSVVASEDVAVPFMPSFEELEGAYDKAADKVVGSLVEQMQQYWSPPNRLSVTVRNAGNVREVSMITSFFKNNIPGVEAAFIESGDEANGTGVARFNILYSSTYEELLQHITEMSNGKLPFDLSGGENRRDAMTITIKKAG